MVCPCVDPWSILEKSVLQAVLEVGDGSTSCCKWDGKRDNLALCLDLVEVDAGGLCLREEVTGMDPGDHVDVDISLHGRVRSAAADGSTRAESQDKIGSFVADHGADVIWCVVGSTADRISSSTRYRDTSRVARVVLHGGDDFQTASREGVAVDV